MYAGLPFKVAGISLQVAQDLTNNQAFHWDIIWVPAIHEHGTNLATQKKEQISLI
jgi:hypothetical protein